MMISNLLLFWAKTQENISFPQLEAEEYTLKSFLHGISEHEGIHDFICHVDTEIFPTHRFIVFSRAKDSMELVPKFNDMDILGLITKIYGQNI